MLNEFALQLNNSTLSSRVITLCNDGLQQVLGSREHINENARNKEHAIGHFLQNFTKIYNFNKII